MIALQDIKGKSIITINTVDVRLPSLNISIPIKIRKCEHFILNYARNLEGFAKVMYSTQSLPLDTKLFFLL